MTRSSASAEATVIVAVRAAPLEQGDLPEPVTLGELSDDAPTDRGLQVAGQEDVESFPPGRPLGRPWFRAENGLRLPEERKA